ncbi:MAG TPA: hypothetical protein VJ850_07680 [Candidatus Limnocylindrales bacterium]|nr:hypothetical protein [Candidatus Limnocylindrales bacterium]
MTARTTTPIELLYGALGADGAPGGTTGLPPSVADLATHVRSTKRGLGAQLLAMGLWNLRDAGALGIELRKGKSLGFIPKTELIISPGNGSTAWSGVEAELLGKLREKGARDVSSLVSSWYGSRGAGNPDGVALGRIRDAAVAAGLVRTATVEANRGFLGRAVRGATKQAYVADAAAIAAAAPDLDTIATGWMAFTRSEPELARELVERVDKAIERKGTEQNDGDIGGGGGDFD